MEPFDTFGKANKVSVVGNFAYVADGDKGLQIIDISNPNTPIFKGTYDTSGYAYDVKVVGQMAYVADGANGLQIIDISNPGFLVLKGNYNTVGYAHSVTVVDNLAYVGDDLVGLQIVDITNPAAPVAKGIFDTTGATSSVTVAGNYAYVTDWESSKLQVIEITDPTAPILKSTYKTSGSPWEVAVQGNYAYVAQHNGNLDIIDISNPDSLTQVGSYQTADAAYGITIVNNLAYIATNNAGVEVLDISNPAAPILAASYDTTGNAVGVSVVGNSVYVADWQSGLQILNVNPNDWSQPAPTDITLSNDSIAENKKVGSVVGNFATVNPVSDETFSYSLVSGEGDSDNSLFTIKDNQLLTNKIFDYESKTNYSIRVRTSTDKGLSYTEQFTINVTNEKEIIFKGTYNTPNLALGVELAGKYAYVADSRTGVQIIDVSSPSTFSIVSTYDTVGTARNVKVAGQMAFVADGSAGIQIIDISNPLSPTLKTNYYTSSANGLTIVDNYLYLADGNSGLVILDITNPTTPILRGTVGTVGLAREVEIVGQTAYIADEFAGLQIIDISNKNFPITVGNYNTPGKALDVAIVGDYAYIADEYAGLQIIDISDKTAPTLVGTFDTSGVAQNVTVVGQYAFVADGASGLQIIDISNPTLPTLSATYDTPGSAIGVSILGNYAYVADNSLGLHSFDVTEFVNSSSNNFILKTNSVTQNQTLGSVELPQITTTAITLSGDSKIDGILSNYKWDFSGGNKILTYSFFSNSVFAGTYYGNETGVKEVSEGVKNNYRKIFNWLENVIDIDFVEVTESPNNHGRIRIMSSNIPTSAYAKISQDYLYNLVGNIHLNPNFDQIGFANGFQEFPGSNGYTSLIHELGHILGLKHPQDSSLTLSPQDDNNTNSVMTNNFTNQSGGTFMLYDVKALQYLYGAKQYNESNTTYQFSSRVDKFLVNNQISLDTPYQVKQLIWDSSGEDTFDFSGLSLNSSGYHLDLNPGGILTPQSDYNATTYKVNQVNYTTSTYGTVIADNVLIENVINSSSNDEIFANSAANTFSGYSPTRQTGNDIYWNTDSNDTLDLSAYSSFDLTQTQNENDLILKLSNNGTITVKNYYQGNAPNLLFNTSLQPSLFINDVTVVEGNNGISQAIFTVSLSSASTQPITVNYATENGTAIAGSDYVEKNGTLTFAPGISSQTITIDIYGDNFAEQDEKFGVTLINATNATISDGFAFGIINNDDVFPSITLALNPSSVTEDGTTNLVYTFTRTGTTANALTVNFAIGGTATFDSDYTQSGATSFTSTSGTVTFAAGSSTATVTLDAVSDTIFEDNETVALMLGSNSNYTIATTTPIIGTINNDDLPVISLAVDLSSVTEDGTANLVYTFTRTGLTTDALTINFAVEGTATFDTDYTQTGAASFTATSGTVTFAAGSSTATVTIDPTLDSIFELDETVALTLSTNPNYTLATTTPVIGTINSDDFPVITLVVNPSTKTEDQTGNIIYTFTRTGSTTDALTVNFLVEGTATFNSDYTQTGATSFTTTNGSVTFAAGSSTATVIIDPTPDATIEDNETVDLTLDSNPNYRLGTTTVASAKINDDDYPLVTLDLNPTSVTEDGSTNLVYTFTRTGPEATTFPLTVYFSLGGTATVNSDYSLNGATLLPSSRGSVSFAAGSSTATVTIDPTSDTVFEDNETVTLTLDSSNLYTVGTPNVVIGTINNDDLPVITLALNPSSVTEDGTTNLVYTFTRTGLTIDALTVNFAVAGTASFNADYTQSGASNFTTTSGNITFAAGSSTAIVTIDPTNDTSFEDNETVALSLSNNSNYAIATTTPITGTINNDDLPLISLALNPVSVTEDGTANLVYTFTRTGTTTNSLTVNLAVGGTASFNTDYTQTGAASFTTTTGTVTFAAGSSIATVIVDPTSDTSFENNETVALTLSNNSNYAIATTTPITGTINNDEVPALVISRWATRQGGFWDTQKWLTGDFNSDGKDDLAKVFNDEGLASIGVHLSNGSSFTPERWATRQGGFWDTQKWLTGDFNGDGKDDVTKVFDDGGAASIDVHLSNGSSFTPQRWATRQGGFWDTQKWLTGDFNGDGKDDVTKVFDDGGAASIGVHLSNGSSFTPERWATRQGGFWDTQKWLVGDFNGDGKDDLLKVFNDEGFASIGVHLSNGSSFTSERWATRQGGFWDTQKWMVGDFNGDGRDDLAKVFNDLNNASIDVHLSNGSSFTPERWGTRQGGFWDTQKWLTGDFNGNGRDDFTKVFNDAGNASIDVHALI